MSSRSLVAWDWRPCLTRALSLHARESLVKNPVCDKAAVEDFDRLRNFSGCRGYSVLCARRSQAASLSLPPRLALLRSMSKSWAAAWTGSWTAARAAHWADTRAPWRSGATDGEAAEFRLPAGTAHGLGCERGGCCHHQSVLEGGAEDAGAGCNLGAKTQ